MLWFVCGKTLRDGGISNEAIHEMTGMENIEGFLQGQRL